MPLSWKLYRIACILQMTSSAFMLLRTLFDSFEHASFTMVARLVLFLLVILQAIFAVNILNNNYPDTPVTGSQKTNFNRLFLLNFLFLAFLFGFIISEFRLLKQLADLIGRNLFKLPFNLWITFLAYFFTLILQLVILYGLYNLRRVLYVNFMKRKFEFEKES